MVQKSCTSWYGKHPHHLQGFSTIQTVVGLGISSNHQQFWDTWDPMGIPSGMCQRILVFRADAQPFEESGRPTAPPVESSLTENDQRLNGLTEHDGKRETPRGKTHTSQRRWCFTKKMIEIYMQYVCFWGIVSSLRYKIQMLHVFIMYLHQVKNFHI